jgi:hypothetical protein
VAVGEIPERFSTAPTINLTVAQQRQTQQQHMTR